MAGVGDKRVAFSKTSLIQISMDQLSMLELTGFVILF